MDVVVATVASAIGALVTLVYAWLQRTNPERLLAKVEETETSLRETGATSSGSDEELSTTWADIESLSARDDELRRFLGSLSNRIQRLEVGTERLDVRRHALLETYHNQGLAQAQISFWFSLALGLLGFGVIVYALFVQEESVATYVAGIVTEAIAALFFTQSNRARRLMVSFFDKARSDRRLEESLRLTDGIANPTLKSATQAALALQLVEASVSPSILPGFQTAPGAENGASTGRTD